MSYQSCPLLYLRPGARPGENLRRGDLSIRHHDMIRDTPPRDEDGPLVYANRYAG